MARATSRKSGLSAKTNQKRNTKSGRERMSSDQFAVPKGKGSKPDEDQYRVDTKAHARNAKARASQFASPQEQRMVDRKVASKYPSIGKTDSKDKSSGKTKTGGKKKKS